MDLDIAQFAANIVASETGVTMTGDDTKTGPWWRMAWPGRAGPNRPPAAADEIHKQSMAELSRRLGERTAQRAAVDPRAAAAARRAALQAYEHARERQMIVGLSVAVAAIIGAGTVYLVWPDGSPPDTASANAAAPTEPASPLLMAADAPAPDSPQSTSPAPAASAPSPAASVPGTPAIDMASAPPAPAMDSHPAPAEPAASEAALGPDDVREVQARLRSFGFNPGPIDGNSGRMTEAAVMHYQQARDQPQTGRVDRELLEQLRQDPAPQVAPQVAQRAARPGPRGTSAPAPRRSSPFEPVRQAGDRFGRWLDSLVR